MALALILLFLYPVSLRAAGLTLTAGGKSPYTIVLSGEGSSSERRGAEELQRFLEQMSGARLPIEVEPVRGRGPFVFIGRGKQLETLKPGIDFDKLDYTVQASPRDFFYLTRRRTAS